MTMDSELNREIVSLESEKRMDKVALKGYQSSISEKLNGSMGNDMLEVLSGKKKIKISRWEKIKFKLKNLLWHLTSEQ